jgi:lipopolysaccharide transport system permease protein
MSPAVTDARPHGIEEWIIEPRAPGIGHRLQEVWRYRYLFVYFAREIGLELLRQSPLGWLWLLLRSGLPAVISAIVFGGIGGFPSGSVPYLLFVIVGTAVWQMFEFSLLTATRAFRRYSRLLTRLYFPRIILLPASTAESFVRLGIFAVLILMAATYFYLSQGSWYLSLGAWPLAVFALVLSWSFALAFGLWTSVIEGPARDVRYSVRYALRFWFFLTPVIYPLQFVPEQWRWLVGLNPMTGIVEMFRLGILGEGDVGPMSVAVPLVAILLVGAGGLIWFGRAEARMIDSL